MKKALIGIEVGCTAVNMAQLAEGKAIALSMRTPDNLLQGETVTSPEALSTFLKNMKAEGGFDGNKVAIILPEDSTFFRVVTMPPISDAQVKLNLPYEFRDYVGNEGIEYNYDYAVEQVNYAEDETPESVEMFAAAGRKDVVNQYAEILRRGGMRMRVALPREMALVKLLKAAVQGGFDPQKEICLVDIDYEHTHINIARGGRLVAAKTVDVGCRAIDAAIADAHNIDIFLAASYRETNHQNVLAEPYCATVYDQLALEVMKAANFYRYESPDSDLSTLMVCGAGANIAELEATLQSTTQLQKGDLAQILPQAFHDLPDAARCVTAIGVAL